MNKLIFASDRFDHCRHKFAIIILGILLLLGTAVHWYFSSNYEENSFTEEIEVSVLKEPSLGVIVIEPRYHGNGVVELQTSGGYAIVIQQEGEVNIPPEYKVGSEVFVRYHSHGLREVCVVGAKRCQERSIYVKVNSRIFNFSTPEVVQ